MPGGRLVRPYVLVLGTLAVSLALPVTAGASTGRSGLPKPAAVGPGASPFGRYAPKRSEQHAVPQRPATRAPHVRPAAPPSTTLRTFPSSLDRLLGRSPSASPSLPRLTCTSTGSANWSNAAIWSCGQVPTAADDVI